MEEQGFNEILVSLLSIYEFGIRILNVVNIGLCLVINQWVVCEIVVRNVD